MEKQNDLNRTVVGFSEFKLVLNSLFILIPVLHFSTGSTIHANLGILQDQFPGVSVPSYFSPASNTHFLQIIFNIGQPSLSWFSKGPSLLLGYSENTFFTVLSSGIL